MLFTRVSGIAVAGALLVAVASPAAAQTTYPSMKLQGRLQSQFYYLGNEDYAPGVGTQSNFFLRRARIEAKGQINEYISVYIQPSFEGGRSTSGSCSRVVIDGPLPDSATVSCSLTGGVRLRDAWIDVRLSKPDAKTALTLRLGQEKRPFSRYELTSSNNLPSIERGAGRGLVAAGSNDIFGAAGFRSHDVGARARIEHQLDAAGRMVSVVAGIYNGRGESVQDNNNAKSFGVRANAGLYRKLSIGGSFFSHDQIVGSDSAFRNTAWGVDGQWSKPGDEGFFALAEYLSGEVATNGRPKMTGIQVLAAYNIRLKNPTGWFYAIEPSLRFDYADPNTEVDDNGATLITAALGLYLSSRAQIRIGYENQRFQADGAGSISGVRTALAVNF
jgi:hypothetical protein